MNNSWYGIYDSEDNLVGRTDDRAVAVEYVNTTGGGYWFVERPLAAIESAPVIAAAG